MSTPHHALIRPRYLAIAAAAIAIAVAGAVFLAVGDSAGRSALYSLAGGLVVIAAVVAVVLRPTERRLTEDDRRARAAADMLRDITERSADWFWETDTEHRYHRGPVFAGARHGLPFDTVVGLTREQVADPEDVRADPDKWRRHREDHDNRRPFRNFEYRLRRPDGSVGWVRASGWPVFLENGSFLGYRGTASDIEELKSRVLALAESEARFKLAATAARLGIWQWYPNSGRFVISPSLKRMLGYKGTEIADSLEAWRRLVHPQDLARVERAMTQATRRGPGASFELSCRLMHKKGDVWWGQLRGHCPDLADGAEPHMIGAVVDITARAVAQQQLERREVMMGHAQHLARFGGWECDAATRRAVWSDMMFDILGVPRTETDIGLDTLIQRVHPEDRDWVATALEGALRGKAVFHREFRIAHPAGDKMVAGYAKLAADSAGKRKVLYGVIQDVTEARRADRELGAQNRRLRLAEEVAGMGHWQVDLATSAVVWSDQTYRIHGVAPESFEVTLESALAFYPLGDVEVVQRHLAEAVAEKRGFEFELHIVRADGALRDVHAVGRCHTDEAGNVVQIFGVFRDITETKARDLAVRESAARLKGVVDTAMDGVVLIDSSGTMLMVNPACRRLFGYAPDEMIGRNVKMLMPPPYRDEHDRYLENYRRTGEAKVIGSGREVVGRRKDGETFPLDLSVGKVTQNGETIFVGFLHDLSGHKAAAAQLVQAQKMEAVGQLAGGIAHDFNNILTIISGNLDLAKRVAEQPEKLAVLIDRAATAAGRAAELTKRLLAFSRKQVLESRILDVNQAVLAMRPLIQSTVGDPVEVTMTLADHPWPTLVDPHQLEAALLNLSVNARDAMPDGGQMAIETHNVVVDDGYARMENITAGDYVLVSVSDTGGGMAPEVAARAFEPFFTTKEAGKGTGLGLSMVFGFVKQTQGHIKVYSEPGRGTTIKLYFPRHHDADAGTPAASDAPAAIEDDASVPSGSQSVLVVDDDEAVRAVVAEMLSDLGYRVREASRGDEALAALAADADVDLLLTDVAMPGKMDGLDLAEQATRLYPHLKVILASGYAAGALSRIDRKDPAFGWINKPFDRARLAREIREVLDRDQIRLDA